MYLLITRSAFLFNSFIYFFYRATPLIILVSKGDAGYVLSNVFGSGLKAVASLEFSAGGFFHTAQNNLFIENQEDFVGSPTVLAGSNTVE